MPRPNPTIPSPTFADAACGAPTFPVKFGLLDGLRMESAPWKTLLKTFSKNGLKSESSESQNREKMNQTFENCRFFDTIGLRVSYPARLVRQQTASA